MTAVAAEVLAGELFRWNTPGDPYFVIHGRAGDACVEDPYLPIARAVLTAVAEGRVPGVVLGSRDVPPGPCWHDPGITWPDGQHPRCELLAGHAGAHQWDRGDKGGTAVWTEAAGQRQPVEFVAAAETRLCLDRNPENLGMSCGLTAGHNGAHRFSSTQGAGEWPLVAPLGSCAASGCIKGYLHQGACDA